MVLILMVLKASKQIVLEGIQKVFLCLVDYLG